MKQWIIGLGFSLVFGGFITWLFLAILRSKLGGKPRSGKRVPPWLTGIVERLFFTILVGLGASGIPTAMMGWLGLKLVTNWNHPEWKGKAGVRTVALSALLTGLISMLFAYLGGMICAGTFSFDIKLPDLSLRN